MFHCGFSCPGPKGNAKGILEELLSVMTNVFKGVIT